MEKKPEYERLEIEVIYFADEDVIITSGTGGGTKTGEYPLD